MSWGENYALYDDAQTSDFNNAYVVRQRSLTIY